MVFLVLVSFTARTQSLTTTTLSMKLVLSIKGRMGCRDERMAHHNKLDRRLLMTMVLVFVMFVSLML